MYLLIGFWYASDRDLRQPEGFLVNRVGDFGFCSASHRAMYSAPSIARRYSATPARSANTIEIDGHEWSLMTVICILLFVGAMGKSAQFPLHVWLPDSMEGPTPIRP